jgi:hypothetical protein
MTAITDTDELAASTTFHAELAARIDAAEPIRA